MLGVKNYKAAFRLLHAVVGIFYCPERSSLTFRMCFDKARQNIRVSWNAQVIPKAIFGGYKTTLHVDGISVYEISRISGNITQHRIERLVINDAFYMPEKGIIPALRGEAVKSNVGNIPVFNVNDQTQILPFQNFRPSSRSLFQTSIDDENIISTTQLNSMDLDRSSSMEFNDALEKKNLLRKKFGLDPLTPEEFMDLQKQVAELDVQQQQRAATSAADMAKRKKEEEGGLFKKLFGKALENTCEDNYDCERPEVCCDFGFKKMCCTSGMRVMDGPMRSRQGQLAEIPVIASPGPYPPMDPRGNQY